MNFQMTLFRNKINLLDLMFSSSDGYLSAIIEAFIFFVIRLSAKVVKRTFQTNQRPKWFMRCLTGSLYLCVSFSSSQLVSTFRRSSQCAILHKYICLSKSGIINLDFYI